MEQLPRTIAQKYIEDYHIKEGQTISFLISANEQQNLPQKHINPSDPTRIDLLGGRPTNVTCTEKGFEADLCFQGPPQRCIFDWVDVIAVSTNASANEWKLLVIPASAIQLEDNSFFVVLHAHSESSSQEKEMKEEPPKKKKPHPSFLKVVK